jgi:putative transposase
MLTYRESAALAKRLIETTIEREAIEPGILTLHADRGAAMTSKPVAFLLAQLGVIKSHSRPHVSNDNPYSESQFKTMKYRPDFPERFGCYQNAHQFCTEFFPWYNHAHHHSGLGYLTAYDVHYGLAEKRREQRAVVLQDAFEKNPQRFVRGLPKPALLPTAAWINKPTSRSESTAPANSAIVQTAQENDLHICPITNDQPSGKGMARDENHATENFLA